jgi:hypothetical protein
VHRDDQFFAKEVGIGHRIYGASSRRAALKLASSPAILQWLQTRRAANAEFYAGGMKIYDSSPQYPIHVSVDDYRAVCMSPGMSERNSTTELGNSSKPKLGPTPARGDKTGWTVDGGQTYFQKRADYEEALTAMYQRGEDAQS